MLTEPRGRNAGGRFTEVQIPGPLRCPCGCPVKPCDADVQRHSIRIVCHRCHAVLIEITQLVETL
jgi:hypothetical protein